MPVQAVVAGALRATRIEYRQLSFQANRGARDQRFAGSHARGIDRLAGGEIVRAVQHQIDRGHRGRQGIGIQSLGIELQADGRIDRAQTRRRRFDLGLTDAVAVVSNLALQVAQIDLIEIGQVQFAHTGRGQIQGHRRAQPAEADDQHTALLEAQLPGDIDLRQENLPAVAQQVVVRQVHAHACQLPSEIRSCPPRSRRLST